MPPKGERQKTENGAEQRTAEAGVFLERIRAYEPGVVIDKHDHPLRAEDGSFLKHSEIKKYFREVFAQETGITNKTIHRHVIRYYITPALSQLRAAIEARRQGADESINEEYEQAEAQLLSDMLGLLSNPENYGLDQELQSVSRHELQYDVDDDGEYDRYEKLDALLADEELVPDPLYVSGRLPTTKVISDACKRLYEKWYPENKGEDQTARQLIKEKCIDQVIRELEVVEQGRDGEKRNFFEREQAIDEKVQTLTTVMRQLRQEDGAYMAHYVNMAAFGPYSKETGYPDDLVPLATFYKRPPYNLEAGAASSDEKILALVDFYRTVYKEMPEADQAAVEQQFDAGSTAFFRDEAGSISSANAYAKLEMIFRHKGFTEEQITGMCAGHIAEVVDEMARFERRYKDLHQQRADVQSIDELRIINQEIARMKNEGRGQLRKQMLRTATQITKNKDFLELLPIQPDHDPLAVLSGTELSQASAEVAAESPYAFDFGVLPDRDSRLEEGERYEKTLRDYMQTYFDNAGANEAAKSNTYVEKRDALGPALAEMHKMLKESGDVDEASFRSHLAQIQVLCEDIIAAINAASSVQETNTVE